MASLSKSFCRSATESFDNDRKKQFTALANAIKMNSKIKDIVEIRDALVYDVDSEGKMSFLIPKERAGVKVYYELTPWFGCHFESEKEDLLSDADLNTFSPTKKEREKFDQMVNGKINSFKISSGSHDLRVFYSKTVNEQEIIVLFDTSKQLKNYRGSF